MVRKVSKSIVLVLGLYLVSGGGDAQAQVVDPEGHQWWQHAVFYEICPRSLTDSKNNGIGDLNGITSNLDYLKDLGVDAILS